MRFTQDLSSNVNVIRGYGPGELRINQEVFTGTLVVSASSLRSEPGVSDVADLTAEHAARILDFEPEVVLIGTGPRQVFPDAAFSTRFLRLGIGVEVMDTGAACRTFNVLVSEQRRVAALLIF